MHLPAAQSSIPLPESLYEILTLLYNPSHTSSPSPTSYSLISIPPADWETLTTQEPCTEHPLYFTLHHGQLLIFPLPQQPFTLSIEYTTYHTL